ncbi:ATP-dependent endonuclease [Burkholderia pseudomallei]|uniref:ATP-dependent nuclease n=1 Tax=Burkholderia pseudomallei TaxID=28450 RepID=UPI00050ED0B1|nr:ATP-binding protein [Burkholderia pseudomallei]KGC61469.1 AAA ATPase domain protein [Burkholderia pseudomallei]ONC42186.1 ATP-dependent endonuclease [Burkholderia pseudomallei]
MVRIRKIEIRNFRSIRSLDWTPSAGINCLVGPGDSGKSSILDAIDLCLGARRNLSFGDTDFFGLDVTQPVIISLTVGALPDALKNLDAYGDFLRGFDAATAQVEDEPRAGIETALTLRLTVASDLEPNWTLFSERAQLLGLERALPWKDRVALAPARIGSYANTNLSWTRGSVLNKLSEERANLGAELARAAREARANFGTQAAAQLAESLGIVTATATSLGVPVGTSAQALLDSHSVSISDGAIALHNEAGVPLRCLGTGSARLLVAGLQRAAAEAATIALVDEVEYGLEPHRLVRLLDSLGAKDPALPLQVFMTTHSPVAIRELSGRQVFVVRSSLAGHQVHNVGVADDVQSTIRADPEAFLAKSIIVCEGASEVGFARGLDQYWASQRHQSFLAYGGAYVNVGGGDPDKCYARGTALRKLGYRVMVLVDADKVPNQESVDALRAAGGEDLTWRPGRALEDELFLSLDDGAIHALLQQAVEFVGEELVNANIQSQSNGAKTLNSVFGEGKFESIAKDIVGPNLGTADGAFVALVEQLFRWTHAA